MSHSSSNSRSSKRDQEKTGNASIQKGVSIENSHVNVNGSIVGRDQIILIVDPTGGKVSHPLLSQWENAINKIYHEQLIGGDFKDEKKSITLHKDALLSFPSTKYVIKEIITQRNEGSIVIRAARASDPILQHDVGIQQIETLIDPTEHRDIADILHKVAERARKITQAALTSHHLPRTYNIIEGSQATWVINEWITGLPLSQHYHPYNGALPAKSNLNQILTWAVDICDSLHALHTHYATHSKINAETIVITKERRGAVLVNPNFAGEHLAIQSELASFDPTKDIQSLTETLYRILTHRPPQISKASSFNPAISSHLDHLLHEGWSGHIKQSHNLQEKLLYAKHALTRSE